MEISKEAIEEFRKIYRDEFGNEIDEEKARVMGTSLLKLIKIIFTPNKQLRVEV